MKFVINDEKWAETLQEGVNEYVDSLQNYYIYGDEDVEEPEVLSGLPYCGCETCYTREFLFYVSPIIMQGQKDGKIELNAS
jgi:hypothetical protein